MRYVLEVYLPKCDGWFTTFKGKSVTILDDKSQNAKKQIISTELSKGKKKKCLIHLLRLVQLSNSIQE